MNYRQLISISILAITLLGCQHPGKQVDSSAVFVAPETDVQKPWTGLDFLNDPNNFQFAIIADLHGGYRSGIFEDAVKKINLMQPEFVLSVGDLIAGYSEDEKTIGNQWAEFERRLLPLGMKFFFVPGNHDLSNLSMTREWEERFRLTYYHFVYRNVLFLCLNSEDPPDTHISEEQIDYVGRVLAENPDVRWTFTFMHKPLWLEKDTGWEKVETMLAERPHTVLAGHHHVYTKYERHGQSYIRLATTGGISELRGPTLGQFDHVTWVTVTDTGPIIANLALSGILDENIVTEDTMALVEILGSGRWLNIDRILVRTGGFTTGMADVNLTNDGTVPLYIKGAFRPHNQLELSRSAIDVTLAPGGVETVPVRISSKAPIELANLDPLQLKISAAYTSPGRLPIIAEDFHQIVFYSWRGPERVRNGGFAQGLEGWHVLTRTPESGTVWAESEELRAKFAAGEANWSAVASQPVSGLKAGVHYRFSFRAKGVGRPGFITAFFRDGPSGTAIPIRVNGQVAEYHPIYLTTSLAPHTMDFKIDGGEDIDAAIIVLSFPPAYEVTIDDVSLRPVEKGRTP